MIAKNKKGKSFGGCVRYVLNEDCEILGAEGVMSHDEVSIIRDFAVQRSGRPEIKQPVGHIPISFSAEDTPRLTNDFMVQLAKEYMQEMGIGNTQYIVVRHNDTAHPHIHIVYNRIDNYLKVISVNNDYKRNIKACKKLKDQYGLTYGETGKEKVNRPKLQGKDKVQYEIHDTIKAILPKCWSFDELEKRVKQGGIFIKYKYRSGAEELPENIQGVSFEKSGWAFKGSEIDKKFSYGNLKKTLSANLNEAWEKIKEQIMPEVVKPLPSAEAISPKPVERVTASVCQEPKPTQPVKRNPRIGGIELTDEQDKTLQDGGHIYLENMEKKDGSGKFSGYVFLNDEKKRVFFSRENPDTMVEYGKWEMRLRDKILIEQGHITQAKIKYYGISSFARPYLWKPEAVKRESSQIDVVSELCSDSKYHGSWSDPRISKEVHEKEMKEFREKIKSKIPKPEKGPSLG